MSTKKILLIPHLKIHNANALSSPYTIGFPAMTAWLGAVHALERKLKAPQVYEGEAYTEYEDLHFIGMAVACHEINLQTYKGDNDFVHSIIGTGNPLDKTGRRPSFIEEARCHLEVSLLIEFETDEDTQDLADDVAEQLQGNMKIAGGDILSCHYSKIETMEVSSENETRKLMGKLMPSHCLIERRDLMQAAMHGGQDAIDALLDYLAVHHHCEVEQKNNKENVIWTSQRKTKGWIVPIATGFHGISDLGIAENQRDETTPHRFAESIVTLGQFIMPYRIKDLDNMLWHYHADLENNLYLCQQNKPSTE
jgi:CRISPR-associated protein Csy2